MGLYNAEISAGSLMLPESRRIARLLLTQPTPEQWDEALKSENLLQKKPATARRQARLIRKQAEGSVSARVLFETVIAPLKGAPQPKAFTF